VQHDRVVLRVVLADVLGIKPLLRGQLVVDLDGAALPLAAERVDQRKLELGPVEGAFAGRDLVGKVRLLAGVGKGCLCPVPGRVVSDALFGPGRELDQDGIRVEAEVAVHALEQLAEFGHFAGNLLFRAEYVAVVLDEAAHAHDAVQRS